MFDEMNEKMQEILRLVKEELKMIKTGRAKPSMIEDVEVEAYPGQSMKLIELASINAPDPHLLLVQPWDQDTIEPIEKALRKADMHLNPAVEGSVIRIPVPKLTEERRKEMVKLVNQKIESGRQMMREARNSMKRLVDDKEGEPGVSEDDIHEWLEEMQERYESFMDKLESMGEEKEKELMKI